MVNSLSNVNCSFGNCYFKRKSPFKEHIQTAPAENNSKITIKEGFELAGQGFLNRAKGIFSSIVKHPLQTAAIIGGTALGLSLLPLVGISMATGAAAMALGFAGIAVFNSAKDILKGLKDYKNGNNNELRKDLKNIGGDCLDLALSVPFIPKGIQQIKRQVKFSPKIRFNKELWGNVKNANGVFNKLKELSKGNVRITFNQNVKEMGLKTPPELEFSDNMALGAGYDFTNGKIIVSTKLLNPLTSNFCDAAIKHELKHCDQAVTMVRAKELILNGEKLSGLDAFEKVCNSNNKKVAGPFFFNDELPKVNTDFYNNVIKDQGVIIPGTKESKQAQKYLEAWNNYPATWLNDSIESFPNLKEMWSIYKSYRYNVMEQEAYTVGNNFKKLRPAVLDTYTRELVNISDKNQS